MEELASVGMASGTQRTGEDLLNIGVRLALVCGLTSGKEDK